MKKLLYLLALALAFNLSVFAQCRLVFNPVTSDFNINCSQGSGASIKPYVATFNAGDTQLTATASVHGQGNRAVNMGCRFTNAGTSTAFYPKGGAGTVDDATGNYTLLLSDTPGTPYGGYCVIGGDGTGAGSSGGGGISSVTLSMPSGFSVAGSPGANLAVTSAISGLVKAASGAFSAAIAGVDYVAPSGNAATATALAADGTNCTNQFPRGIDASGNAQGCASVTNNDIQAATIDLTSKVTGALPVANGGTGLSVLTQYALLYASASGTVGQIPIGTTGQCLVVNSTRTGYAFQTCGIPPYAVTFVSGDAQKTVTATVHGQGTTPYLAGCALISGGVATEFHPWNFSANSTTGDVTIDLVNSGTIGTGGVCLIAGAASGGGSGGGSGSVSLSMPGGFSVSGSPGNALSVTTALSGVIVASAGSFAAVTGNPTDCVKVNGTSGGCATGTLTNLDSSIDGATHSNDPVILSNTAGDVKRGSRTGNTGKFVTADSSDFTAHIGEVLKIDSSGNGTPGGLGSTRVCTVAWTDSTHLTAAPGASASNPCKVAKIGDSTLLAGSVVLTIGGTSSGDIYWGFDLTTGLNKVYQTVASLVTCASQGCTVDTSVSLPPSFVPLWKWTVASGTVASNAGVDMAPEVFGQYAAPGAGINISYNSGQATFSTNSAVVPTHLPAVAATIDFPSLANTACAQSNVTVSGSVVGNRALVSPPSSITDGFTFMARVSAADTVRVQVCNLSGSTVDLASGTYTVEVFQ